MNFFETLSGISLGAISLGSLLSAIVIFLVCCIVISIIMKIVAKLLRNAKHLDNTLKGFIKSAVKVALWILAVIIIADSLGIPTASLVALVSVVSLALSLSVQNIITNIFSGITLLITRPFTAGDLVEISGKTGVVKHLNIFYTILDTLDNNIINIPNGDVVGASILNYSKEPKRRVDMTFCTAYSAPTETVKKAIREAAAQDPKIAKDPEPFIVISKYNDSNIEYIVRVWCDNADYWDVYFGMNERVRECFKANGVEMTYNHINVHTISD